MMRAAIEGARLGAKKYKTKVPKVIGVTVLTSIDKNILNNQLEINKSVEEQVFSLAKISKESGLDGIVCSAADLQKIKGKLPK